MIFICNIYCIYNIDVYLYNINMHIYMYFPLERNSKDLYELYKENGRVGECVWQWWWWG